jgi:hypothetical protein
MKHATLSLSLILACAAPALATHAVGVTPPDFTCTDTAGASWNLLAQRGKVVMVNFGATW